MASEYVGIYLNLMGTEGIDELRAKLLELENKKINIRFDAQNQLSDIEKRIRQLTSSKKEVKVRFDNRLEKFAKDIDKLKSQRINLKTDFSEIVKAEQKLNSLINKQREYGKSLNAPTKSSTFRKMGDDIDRVRNKMEGLQKNFKQTWGTAGDVGGYLNRLGRINDQIGTVNDRVALTRRSLAKAIAPYDKELSNLSSKKQGIKAQLDIDTRNINRDIAEVQQRIKAQRLEATVDLKADMGKFFRGVQSQMSRVGSTFMTLGNTMQRFTAPINTIFRGMAYGVGYQALNKVTEGLKSGFSRYDTMKKYPMMMAQFETKAYSAEKSINALDKSVRGLPTGLDEIVDLAQRFTLSLGDMERGTKLAIATNRAFLASMATDTQQYQGMMQMQDLMNGKKLNSREWMSLGASMGYAINEIGKVLGYDDAGKFRQALYGNKIATEDFLKALEKVGNKGGSVYKQAEYIKSTWQAVAANIGNAFSRLAYNALKSLDSIFKAGTGKSFVQWTDQLRETIDDVSESISGWIKNNPDKILDFFNTIKSYDWIGLGKGIAEGFGNAFKWFKRAGDFLFKDGGNSLGRALVKINLWGKALTLIGGLLKGASFPVATIATAVRFLGHLSGIGNLIKIGIFGKIATKIGDAIKATKGVGKLGEAAAPAMTKWGALAKFGTGVQIAAGGFAIKQLLEGIAEISKVDIPDNIGAILGKATTAIGGLTTLATFAGRALGSNPWAVGGMGVAGLVGFAFAKGIAEVLESVKEFAEGLKILQEIKPINKGAFKKVAESITNIAPNIKDIYTALDKAFPKKRPVSFAEAQKGKGSLASDVKEMLGALEGIADIGGLVGDLAKLKVTEKQIQKAKDSVSNIGEVIGTLKEDIANIFGSETFYANKGQSRGSKKTGKWQRGTYDSSSLQQYAEATGYFQEALTNLTGIVTAVSDFQAEFDRVAGDLFTKGKDGYDSSAIQEKIEGIRTFLNSAFTTNGIGQAMKGATESLKGVDTTAIAGAFSGLIGIITEMCNVQTKLEELSMGESAFDVEGLNLKLGQLGMAIGNLGTALTKAEFNEESLFTIDNIQRAFVKLQAVADQITSMGIDGVLSSIQGAIDKIKGFDWSGMQIPPIDIKVQIKLTPMPIDTTPITIAVIGAIGSISSSVAGIPVNIEKVVPVKLKDKVTGEQGVVNAVKNAIDSVRSQVNALPSTITKTITVRIVRETYTSGGLHTTGGTIPESTGGLVPASGTRPLYRAGGGSIFKPKGTDTVPAMLTPGEYVNKRAVVNKLGVPFFQRLNNLDIPGALRELSIRTGMNLGGGTVINNYNNTTNNTTNNFSLPTSDKDSQNFTMRRIGRFAGAL